MIKLIDNWLNRMTMYRLVEYYLAFLVGVAAVLSFLGVLPYDPFALLFTTGFLIAACWLSNTIFARAFRVSANVESVYISAMILALIITPLQGYHDLITLAWIAVLAMASKYVIAINRKHLFNPVAFAVALTALTINQTASWWIGDASMLPFVIAGGFLIVRKVRRGDLVFSFMLTALLATVAFSYLQGSDLMRSVWELFVASPLVFFACVILTEPLTMPHTAPLQIVYGALVGLLFAPQVHFGSVYLTPELAILAGNLFAYLVSPKAKLVLRLKEKIQLGPDLYDFIFVPRRKLSYAPGQYMEWTLGHEDPDSRGNRRYFTLASSPTENNLRLGVKFPAEASSYKQSLLNMSADTEIMAGHLAGDFTLPRNLNQKCVLIAGGIGITPFRSMVKYLMDTRQRRPLVLFYSVRTPGEIVYKEIFDEARQWLGMKTIYVLTDPSQAPAGWTGRVGRINSRMIMTEVPDFRNCLFYLSSPNAMIDAFEDTLTRMGVSKSQIKKDFFPGF